MVTGYLSAVQKSWLPIRQVAGRRFLLFWIVHLLALITLGGLIAYSLVQDHRLIDSRERDRLVNQTAIVEKNLQPQILMANRVIEHILDRLPMWQDQHDEPLQGSAELRVMNDTLPGIRPILVIRADGVVVASSNAKLIGRTFENRQFIADAARNDPGILHIEARYPAMPGPDVVNVFRTIRSPGGSFGGVVMVCVAPEYFAILLDSVRYAPDMTTSIVRSNGMPFLDSAGGLGSSPVERERLAAFFHMHRRSGNVVDVYDREADSMAEGRLVAIRTMSLASPPVDQPLVIEASRDFDAVLAPWYRALYTQAGLFGVISILSTSGLVLIQRRRRAEARGQQATDERIRKLAYFDHLTGLPNRTLLKERLHLAVANSESQGSYGAVLFIDLDHFKTLNDAFGHHVGDQLLRQVGERLCVCVPLADTVARMGGDEFVVILCGLGGDERQATFEADLAGGRILSALSQTFELDTVGHTTSSSIGVALFKGAETVSDELLKQADLAMYKAKAEGRGALRFFDPAMGIVMAERAAFEADLRVAVRDRQFVLHYQPQVVADGRVTGAEALVRWMHPARGLVSPAQFIPLAEETGLIRPLGHWVLQTACNQLAVWARRRETQHLTMAVNVSAHQFNQPDFVEHVMAILDETGACPRRLKLELTESLLVANVNQVVEKMVALKGQGIGFSLDDFGTGYSSLAYLKRLPLDQLKIDQSFIRDVLTDANDASIARTIIALADSLNLEVIAEGVETTRQLEFLAGSGCYCYQGYLFSRPLPSNEFQMLLVKAASFTP